MDKSSHQNPSSGIAKNADQAQKPSSTEPTQSKSPQAAVKTPVAADSSVHHPAKGAAKEPAAPAPTAKEAAADLQQPKAAPKS
ncbi:hypothetical protein OL229_10460 [Neisseriaceae bacterium JH1-16]|nr:hypothetical protein [Neisseriaceae bacterium JH1-16]